MTKRPHNRKLKRPGELGKPIRPQVIRPRGFAVLIDDHEAIGRENTQMEKLHEKAVETARREKLKLLARHYSLAESDYEGLARALAIEHEPGFQVDRQIAEATLDFSGLVKVEDGELVDGDNRVGRPEYWTVARLFGLLEEVEAKKKELNGPRMKPRVPWMHKTRKSGMAKDLDALRLLAKSDGEHDPRVRTLQVRLNEAKKLKRRVDEEIAVLKKIANQIGK